MATPVDPLPGGTIDVDGDLADDCDPGGTCRVTLRYTLASGVPREVVAATGALAGPDFGTFSTPVAIPDDAMADDSEGESNASVSAVVTCTGSSTSVTATADDLRIAPHTGVLDVQSESIDAGDPVVVTGTTCYGGEDWIGEVDGRSDAGTRTFETEIVTRPRRSRRRVRVLRRVPGDGLRAGDHNGGGGSGAHPVALALAVGASDHDARPRS